MSITSRFFVPAAMLVLASDAAAQCQVFTGDGGGPGVIDRGRAIVGLGYGGPSDVHFYDKTDQGWQHVQSATVGDSHLAFDTSVAMDGDRALAGNSESNGLQGQAFVFDRVGPRWISTELVSATLRPGDFFGSSVALGGDVAVVGALHWGQGGGDELPRMHVFEFGGTSWSEVAQLQPFTWDLAVDGDTIVLGDGRSFPGRVHIYEKVVGLWVWRHRLQVQLPPPNGPFLGTSVALQGDTLAVGAAAAYEVVPGYVKIYRRTGTGWQEIQHIVPSSSVAGDGFGQSVALSGSTLLVGAPAGGPFGPGAVHRFVHDGTRFVESSRFTDDSVSFGFGARVSVYREDAIVSSHDQSDARFFRLGFAQLDSFCPTTPNSTGSHGLLSVAGCDSLGGQRLTLVASGLPPGVLGVFYFGANTTQVPFGNGFSCVGEPAFRFHGGTSDAAGQLVHEVDFDSEPGSRLAAGRTWKIQAHYRDPAAGAGLNTTNALAIRMTP